ncbi:MAG: RNA polymerase sigma factor [Flavobacteriales bacterium]
MSDQEIIALIQAGKEDRALLKLYKNYAQAEYFLRSNGASREEALDVYQDALYILCKKVKEGDFKLTSQLSTYLYSICKYIWKDQLVKKNRQVSFSFDVHDESVDYDGEDNEKTSLAEKALESIGEKCWELLKAFYHEGLSMASIALNFGFANEKSAKNQKYKCLEKARDNYEELAQKLAGQ